MSKDNVVAAIEAARAVAVLRAPDADGAVQACRAMSEGGMRIMEITTTTPGWQRAIGDLSGDGELVVGLGTAIDVAQVTEAKKAGAVFVVSPGFDRAIADCCAEEGLPFFPGVATPTELMAARKHEAVTALKLFPAEVLGGVACMKALKGPFPDVRFMPTGGVNAKNARAYLDAGAIAVGLSAPCKGDLIKAGDWAAITRIAREVVEAVA